MCSPLAADLAHRIAQRFKLYTQEPDVEQRLADMIDARLAELLCREADEAVGEPLYQAEGEGAEIV